MSSYIENQMQQSLDSVSYQIRESEKTQSQNQRKIAEAQPSAKKQAIVKDVVSPAQASKNKSPSKGSNSSQTPSLPGPSRNWGEGPNDQQTGLIAIIGAVMALQARTQSRFWSTMFNTSFKSMMMQVKFAPIIAQAIKQSAEDNANATKAEATKELWTGITSLGMFALTVGAAGFMDMPDDTPKETNTNVPSEKMNTETEEKSEDEALGAKAKPTDQQEQLTKTEQEVSKSINNSGKFADRAKRMFEMIKKSGSTQKMGKFLAKVAHFSNVTQMMSAGTTQMIGWSYDTKKAAFQKSAGIQDALSKECEQYAQFYGTANSRETDLGSQAGQNIDYIMNILKSASDTITQTVTSMFRG